MQTRACHFLNSDYHIGPTQDTSNCVYAVNKIHTTSVTFSTRGSTKYKKPRLVAVANIH